MNAAHVQAAGTPESQATLQEVSILEVSKIKSRIQELRESLEKSIPGYDTILEQVHRNLAEDEALVHLLTPEEVGIICAGLTKKKRMLIIRAEMKKEKKRTGNAVTEDDI